MGSDALANSAFAASQTLTKLKSSLEKSEGANAALRAENADLKNLREQDLESHAETRMQVNRMEEELFSVRRAQANAEEAQRRAVAELRSTEARAESLTKEMCELESRGNGAARDASQRADEVTRLESSLQAEKRRAESLERSNAGLEYDIRAARAELVELRQQQDALKGGEMVVVDSMASELKRATDRCDLLCKEVTRLREELDTAASVHSVEAEQWVVEKRTLKQQLTQESELLLEGAQEKHSAVAAEWAAERAQLQAQAESLEASLIKAAATNDAQAAKLRVLTPQKPGASLGLEHAAVIEAAAVEAALESAGTVWAAEKEGLEQQLRVATNRATDTMQRFLSVQAEVSSLKEKLQQAQAQAMAQSGDVSSSPQKQQLQRQQRSHEHIDDDAAKAAAVASPEKQYDSPQKRSSHKTASPQKPSPSVGGSARDDDDDDEVDELNQSDVEEYAREILGMVLPRCAAPFEKPFCSVFWLLHAQNTLVLVGACLTNNTMYVGIWCVLTRLALCAQGRGVLMGCGGSPGADVAPLRLDGVSRCGWARLLQSPATG